MLNEFITAGTHEYSAEAIPGHAPGPARSGSELPGCRADYSSSHAVALGQAKTQHFATGAPTLYAVQAECSTRNIKAGQARARAQGKHLGRPKRIFDGGPADERRNHQAVRKHFARKFSISRLWRVTQLTLTWFRPICKFGLTAMRCDSSAATLVFSVMSFRQAGLATEYSKRHRTAI